MVTIVLAGCYCVVSDAFCGAGPDSTPAILDMAAVTRERILVGTSA